jgi:hybrid cluster-associated redox disulfide protein
MNTARSLITSEISVADLLSRWPQLIPIFLSRQMSCVGCSMASFDTIQDVAENYHIPVDELLFDLDQAVRPGSE